MHVEKFQILYIILVDKWSTYIFVYFQCTQEESIGHFE